MTQQDFMAKLAEIKVCPVVVIDDVEDAVPLAKALEAGKLPMAEVTFRTPAAAEAIARIAKECPNVVVGAGTVIDREQCTRAINAGAQFIVAPSFSDEVAQCAIGHGVAYCPGTCTPTDITNALRYTFLWLSSSLQETTADLRPSSHLPAYSLSSSSCLQAE